MYNDMPLLYELVDHEYEDKGYDHVRVIVRAILINENNEIALIKVRGTDEFGYRDYYETPGGGVEKNETLTEALIREIDEEVGYKIHSIKPLGRVEDFYNLLKRKNINCYFYAKLGEKTQVHLLEKEKQIFEGIVYVSLDKVLEILKHNNKNKLGKLVYNREYPIFEKVVKEFKELNK